MRRKKIAGLNAIKMERQLNFDIEVDGGVNTDTAKVCVENGATMLVTGSFFFKQEDYKKSHTSIERLSVYAYKFIMF